VGGVVAVGAGDDDDDDDPTSTFGAKVGDDGDENGDAKGLRPLLRERLLNARWSMTIPIDVVPSCSGMNHAQPDSSAAYMRIPR